MWACLGVGVHFADVEWLGDIRIRRCMCVGWVFVWIGMGVGHVCAVGSYCNAFMQ